MDRSKEELEAFDRYFRDELEPGERQQFETNLAEDEDLKKKYEDYLFEISAIQYSNRRNLIDEISKDKDQSSNSFIYLKIAAAIVLLAATFFVIYQTLKSVDYQEVAISYYEKDESLTFERPRGAGANYEIISKAYSHYVNNQIDRGLEEINKIEYIDEVPHGLYLKGLLQLEAGNYQEASGLLEEALLNSPVMEDNIKWYLSLSLLSEEKKDSAVELLKSIEEETYRSKAKNLLEQL